MATRYTYKSLCADIAEINRKLKDAGATRFIEAGSRYNYSAVDILTADQYAYRMGDKTGKSGCLCNLETGSPRECYAAAENFYYQQLEGL